MKIYNTSLLGDHTLSGSLQITGSLNVSGGITGSLLGTASFVTSASFAISSSRAVSSSFTITASKAEQVKIQNNLSSVIYFPTVNESTAGYYDLGMQSTIKYFVDNDTFSAPNIIAGTGFGSITGDFAGNLTGTASYATSASQSISSSFATNASSSLFATTAGTATSATNATNAASCSIVNNISTANDYLLTFVLGTSGNLPLNVDDTRLSYRPSTNTLTVDNLAGNASTATSASYATVASSSLFATTAGTSTTATNANSASNITSAITNAADNRVLTANGGGTINGEANLTFNGTALALTGSLAVTSSGALTLGQFVGNNNGYVEFSVRNNNTGISASGDIAVYADTGTTTNNYIDMGINNSGLSNSYFYGGTDFGNALDAYLYNVGGNLRIGNANSTTVSQSLYLFSNTTATPNIWVTGSQVAISKQSGSINGTFDVNGNTHITGTLNVSAGITGSLNGGSTFSNTTLVFNEDTNTTRYPVFSTSFNGAPSTLYADSTGLTYNPSTNTLTAGTFSGALSGNASTAATASFVTSSNVYGPNGSNSILSASFAVSSSNALTASFLGSSTNAFIQNGNSFGTTALLGTNDNQPLAFETNGSTRMFISSSGNVGIGQSTIQGKLHVYQDTNLGGTAGNSLILQTLQNTGGSGGNLVYIKDYAVRDATGTDWTTWRHHNSIDIDGSHNTPGTNTKTFWERDPNAGVHYFGNQTTTTLTVDAGNNSVGVGGAPESGVALMATVSNNAFGSTAILNNSNSGTSALAQLQLRTANQTSTPFVIHQFNNGASAAITNVANASLVIGTNNTTRVTITNGGAMGLGVTPTNTLGRFEASNDIVAYSSSDKNWKKNVKNINSPLEKLSQINGVEFDWIEDEPLHGNKGHDVGVIAQEIELIIPEAVQTRESGMKAVQYDKIIPLLIESIKEQQKQIDELKELVNKLTK